ncbi:MAG: hypothetical protein ACM336_09995 [Acidobacteriota bacterium]
MRLALLLLCAAAAFGQSRQERGKQTIDAALAALGGEKFLGMKDRVESGRAYSFYREELSGLSVATIYTQYRPGGDLRERQSFGKEEKSGAVLFAEGKGYQITFRGARPLPQEQLDRYRDTTLHNFFYILHERLNEPGMIFEYQGSDIVDNMPVDKVDITDADNRTVTVFLHHSTKLPVRQLYYRRDPKTGYRNEEVTIFGKFRDVGGGVMWPFDVQRLRNGERIYQMYADNVQINQNLSDNLFVLPSDIKILKPLR